jgi:putative DNA primase/helicase
MNNGAMAASYLRHGWQLVPLFGVPAPGVCTCWKGHDCGTPGKHPSGGTAWHLSATNDEETVLSWFDQDGMTIPETGEVVPVNVGLLLGPKSGVIDVELDGDDAKAAWAELDLGEIWTPTYKAGRGPHRLFRWQEDLPAVAVRKVLGIEVRIGNGGKAAQSVIPPSTHHTGVRYEWVEGLSPDDVELQPLPERLLNLLFNDDGSGQARSISRSPAREMLHRPVQTGGRNSELHRFAVSEAFRAGPNLDHEREQQDLLLKIRAVNSIQCKPPLDDSECVAIYRSAIGFVRKNRAAGVSAEAAIIASEAAAPPAVSARQPGLAPTGWQRVFTEVGLSFSPILPDSDSDPEWGPGEWELTIIHSDPIEYRLHVPHWRNHTADHTGNVTLTIDQYRSAPKVAAAVLAATGRIMLDDDPKRWRQIWDGGYKVRDNVSAGDRATKRTARGIKAKLLDNAGEEWPGASSLRYVLLASWLYDRLSQASQPSDDDIPDPTGRAAWRQDGTLWFAWGKLWEDIERQHRVETGERLALRRRLLARMGGTEDFRHAEFRHLGGARKSYVVWSRREFAVLEEMAATLTTSSSPPAQQEQPTE